MEAYKNLETINLAHEMLLDALKQQFKNISEKIEKDIKTIDRLETLKKLHSTTFKCQSIEEFNEFLKTEKRFIGKKGLDYKQNIDAILKWFVQEFKGKTLELFGVNSLKIIKVFNFEPVEIAVRKGMLDIILQDEASELFHLEEQRNMTIDDLKRFAVYHFQGVRQWGFNITDVILISGKSYEGSHEIETKSGTYSPIIIDLTEKDGWKRLEEIKKEVEMGKLDNLMELVFIPIYGKESSEKRSELAVTVLDYEVSLLKNDEFMSNLFYATLIMSNKIIDKALLQKIYKEAKNTMLLLDFLDIVKDEGREEGMAYLLSKLIAQKFSADESNEFSLLSSLSKEDVENLALEISMINSLGGVHNWIYDKINSQT